MSRRRRASRLELDADINVVNLIDVMLLLMVIFMITAPMMSGGVDVSLPQADVAPMEAKDALIVTVTREGMIVMDDTISVSEDIFAASFAAVSANRTGGGVYLRADEAVPYGTVVRVLATMRRAGVADVGLVAEPEEIR